MELQTQIKLTTPMLGSNFTSEKIRRFSKDSQNDMFLAVDQQQWTEAFEKAINILELQCDPANIFVPQTMLSPTLRLYRRNINKSKVEVFESIQKNTILTFNIAVASSTNNQITQSMLEEIFKTIGKYIGLSEWGSKFGFGRFALNYVKQLKNDK